MHSPNDEIKIKRYAFSPASIVDVEFVEIDVEVLNCYSCTCDAMPLQDYVTELYIFSV